jgi:hypothetical protein
VISSRWEVAIKMDLKDIVCEDVDRIQLSQDRDQWRTLVSTEMTLRIP